MNPARLWWWSCRAHRLHLTPVARLLKLINFLLFRAILPYEAHIEKDLLLEHYALGIVCHPNVTLGHRVQIFHHVTLAASAQVGSQHRVVIGDDVVIGVGAILIARENQSLHIGNRAIIGAGAIVTRDVAPDDTMVGTSARSLRARAASISADKEEAASKENDQDSSGYEQNTQETTPDEVTGHKVFRQDPDSYQAGAHSTNGKQQV